MQQGGLPNVRSSTPQHKKHVHSHRGSEKKTNTGESRGNRHVQVAMAPTSMTISGYLNLRIPRLSLVIGSSSESLGSEAR